MNTISYWLSSVHRPAFPALDRDVTVDVAVIGGGITGVTAAYLLKRAGLKVALLERGSIGGVDTGHTTAHVTAVPDTRLHEIARRFGRDAARAVWDAGGAAIDQIVELMRAEAIECDFRWVPGFLHAPTEAADGAAVEELKEEWAMAQELGIEATFMSSVPSLQAPGLRFRHQAIFHPLKYLLPLAARIPGDGSHVFEGSAAETISEDPLEVASGDHRIRCGHLVLATHNPLMGNSGAVAAALFQTKLALYSTYAIGAKLPTGHFQEASFWDTAEPYHYLRVEQRAEQDYAIFGGGDHKTGQSEDTSQVYHELERKLRALEPEAQVDHRWSGQVIETHDGLPYIGETAEKQFAATGFAGNGMTLGTLGAMMAADHILGRKNPWRDLFDVHRRKLLGGTWSYVKENIDYPYYLARNWLAKSEGTSLAELRPGDGKILALHGRKVAASRSDTGEISLCSPVCTHLQCIVAWNNAERTWDCPCHGSRFTAGGEVISGPAEEPLARVDERGEPVEPGKSDRD